MPYTSNENVIKEEVKPSVKPEVESQPKEADEFEILKQEAKNVQNNLAKDDKPKVIQNDPPTSSTPTEVKKDKWENMKIEKLEKKIETSSGGTKAQLLQLLREEKAKKANILGKQSDLEKEVSDLKQQLKDEERKAQISLNNHSNL